MNIDVTGDEIFFHGQRIAKINENAVSATILDEFITLMRDGGSTAKRDGYVSGHQDGSDDHDDELERCKAAMTAFCVKVERGQARSTETYAAFCKLLNR